jgi:peptidoglycan/xylan/chitin deacetylase (PgdA/CDA1 family)
MGVKAALHPDILKRMVDEGHEVANHTWNHPVTSKITREHLKNQLDRTTKAIRSATEFSPTTYRPPYGNTNAQINEYIDKEEKMKVIMWSVDTNVR